MLGPSEPHLLTPIGNAALALYDDVLLLADLDTPRTAACRLASDVAAIDALDGHRMLRTPPKRDEPENMAEQRWDA